MAQTGYPSQSDQPDFDPDAPIITAADGEQADPDVALASIAHVPLDFSADILPEYSQPSAVEATAKFLTLPFEYNSAIRVQQGYIYTNGGTHKGIDFIQGDLDKSSTWKSFPVRAAASGYACGNCSGRQGNAVWIRHSVDGATYYTYYGHLGSIQSRIPLGSQSNTVWVERGDIIGYAGDTGTTGGWVHLHFQSNLGATVYDPYALNTSDRTRYYPGGSNYQGLGANHLFNSAPPSYAIGTVVVDRVWTNDRGSDWGTAKTVFNAGAPIRYIAAVNNTTAGAVSVQMTWEVIGPTGRIMYNTYTLNTAKGVQWWGIDSTIPANAAAGTYTYRFTTTYSGKTVTRSTTFTVQKLTCSTYLAEYYTNRTLSGAPAYQVCEGWPINHDWGSGGPGNGIGNDNFSARWTGAATFSAGNYTFIAEADDGVRVWFDDSMIINEWRDQGTTQFKSTRYVSAGSHRIKIEYYENGGGAVARFRWETANTGTSENLAKGRPAYSWSIENSNYPAIRANDGNMGSRWSSRISSTLGEEWWWVDIGGRTYDKVVIRWENAYATRYYIGWSSDCSNYWGYTYTASSATALVHNIGSHNERCVGIRMLARAPQMNNYSIWEAQVYNGAVAAADAALEEDLAIAIPAGELEQMEMNAASSLYLPLINH